MYDMLETFKARVSTATQEALAEFEAEFNRRYSILRGDKAEAPKEVARKAIAEALSDLEPRFRELPSEFDIQVETNTDE